MFANPNAPNLPDYVSFLYGIVGLDPAQFITFQGQATNGSTTQLFGIASKPFNTTLAGYDCVDVTQGVTALIVSNDPTQVTFAPLANPVNVGDQYLIVPDIGPTSLAVALAIVNDQINQASASLYTLAVYNLAADRLITYAPDIPKQSYFKDMRDKLKLTSISVGVPSQASDQGTAIGILNPEQLKFLTLRDLQYMKTPYGREYLGIAQVVGPIWGLT